MIILVVKRKKLLEEQMTSKKLIAGIAVETGLTQVQVSKVLKALGTVSLKGLEEVGSEVTVGKLFKLKKVFVKEKSGKVNGKAWTKPAHTKVTVKGLSGLNK
jgi:hypothetical protein